MTENGPVVPNQEPRISADSHNAEPLDLWEKRLPEKFRAHAPRYPDRKYGEGQHARRGGWEPEPRLLDMARDRIVAEVLYPTLGKDIYRRTDSPEASEACAYVYNDWMIEFCSEAPDRLWGQCQVPLWNIDWALQELERCRKGGMVGSTVWMIPPDDIPFSSPDHYERFWAASQDLEMPVSMHINTGFGVYAPSGRTQVRRDRLQSLKATATGHKQITADMLTDIICSGVLERYPRLKVVVAEVEVGWIPFWLEELDKRSRRQGLPLKPSEYFYRQCYSTFTEDPVGGQLLEWYGQDSFLWSTDYPHPGTGDVWLYGDEVIGRTMGHLKPEVRAKALRESTAHLYGKPIPELLAVPPEDDPTLDEWRKSRTLYGGD